MSDSPDSMRQVAMPESGAAEAALPGEFIPTDDPLWLMIDGEFTPAREHEFESLFCVSNGYLGNRGALPIGTALSAPTLFLAGVFDVIAPSSLPELVALPGWTLLSQSIGHDHAAPENFSILDHHRLLDMRQGMFRREFRFGDKEGHIMRIRFLRIASMAERHVALQSSLFVSENYSGQLEIRFGFLRSPGTSFIIFSPSASSRETPFGSAHFLEAKTHTGITIALALGSHFSAAADGLREPYIRHTADQTDDVMKIEIKAGKTYRNDWIEVCYTSRDIKQPQEASVALLQRLQADGVTAAIRRHVDAWSRRWQTADVEIEGDEDAQRALRFACYHLMSAANPEDERVSVGAKGLTGSGYKGHVFWDTEIFLLPFYTLTDPPSARALLMYRFHTLSAARDKARQQGYRGALYAWESADTGEEVTPPWAITPMGEVIPVLTGIEAHHISADVAYAVWQYWTATGDDEFLCSAGGEILMETARFWASRGQIEDDGLYHIRNVIGPDEYHESIDDNAYTNWMAQWNLECAAAAARVLKERCPDQWRRLAGRLALHEEEPQAWLALGRVMYTGVHPEHCMIEQFDGYFALEEIDLAQYAPHSLPIDIILGREHTRRTQLVKQADVVMLLHLLSARIPSGMAQTCFRYYEPRTEHGSSLSPAMHALVAARLGDTDMALRYFRQTREIDLANNMGNAASGVHIAALGGLWQAAVFGFAGLNLNERGVAFMPHCPAGWRAIRFPLLWRGQRIEVRIEPALAEIRLADGMPLQVVVGGSTEIRLEAGWQSRWEWLEGTWKETAREYR